ncbi:MAG: alpha/beta fold hydrolase [Acidimicrobiales bacterium]
MPRATVNGVDLDFRLDGPPGGDPVLLVCGTGQPAFSWQVAVAPRLVAAGYRVIAYDNRGVPPSSCPPPPYSVADLVEDAAALVEHLGVGPCRVAGLSLGAFVTQELALARPDLVRAAAMMGTVGRSTALFRAWAQANVELVQAGIVLPGRFTAMTTVMATASPGRQLDDAFVGTMVELMAGAPPWSGPGAEGQYAADLGYDDRLGALAGVTVPSLVIGFEHDLMTPPSLGREVAGAIPGGRYVEVPDCGHMGPFERADAVLRHLLAFFAGT